MRYILYTTTVAVLLNAAACNSGGKTETPAADATVQKIVDTTVAKRDSTTAPDAAYTYDYYHININIDI